MIVYLLYSKRTLNPVYVGSTGTTLEERLATHRKRIRIGGNLNLYKKLAGTDENDIDIQFICRTTDADRFKVEGDWIRYFDSIHPLLNGKHGMSYTKSGVDLEATRRNAVTAREIGKKKGSHAQNHKVHLSLTCRYCIDERTEAEIEMARWIEAERRWKKTTDYKTRPVLCSYCDRVCVGNKGLSCHLTNSHKEVIA